MACSVPSLLQATLEGAPGSIIPAPPGGVFAAFHEDAVCVWLGGRWINTEWTWTARNTSCPSLTSRPDGQVGGCPEESVLPGALFS